MTPDLGRVAWGYARRGIPVFQLVEGGKTPMPGGHGHRDASCDLDVTRARWNRWPRRNIGMATGPISGVWGLDVDKQSDGWSSLKHWTDEFGPLPLTVTTHTPSGGALHRQTDARAARLLPPRTIYQCG